VTVHDLRSGELLWRNDDVLSNWVKFDARDPHLLMVGTNDGEVCGYDVRAGTACLWTSPAKLNAKVDTIAMSPDARWLAWGGDGSRVLLWDRDGGKTLALDTGATHVSQIIWDRSNQLLVSTGVRDVVPTKSGQIQVWDPFLARCTKEIRAHHAGIHALSLDSTGRVVASGSTDMTVKLWDWRAGLELATLGSHQTRVYSLAWSPGGEVLVSGDSGGNLLVWDRDSYCCLTKLADPAHAAFAVRFFADDAFAVATEGGLVTCYDLRAFDRAIAGNTRYWLDHIPSSEQNPERAAELRRWSQRVLAEAAH
jgi:WD40 repeat protein